MMTSASWYGFYPSIRVSLSSLTKLGYAHSVRECGLPTFLFCSSCVALHILLFPKTLRPTTITLTITILFGSLFHKSSLSYSPLKMKFWSPSLSMYVQCLVNHRHDFCGLILECFIRLSYGLLHILECLFIICLPSHIFYLQVVDNEQKNTYTQWCAQKHSKNIWKL